MHIRIIFILVIKDKKAFIILWLGVSCRILGHFWSIRSLTGLGVFERGLYPAVDYRSLADIELDGASLRLLFLRLLGGWYLDGLEVSLEIAPPLKRRIYALKFFLGRIGLAHWRLTNVLLFVGPATIFVCIQDVSDSVILEIELG